MVDKLAIKSLKKAIEMICAGTGHVEVLNKELKWL